MSAGGGLTQSNSQVFIDHMVEENRQLADESQKLVPSSTAWLEKMTAELKDNQQALSMLFEPAYYNMYLVLTLKELHQILAPDTFCYRRNPIFFYCDMEMMEGYLYMIDIQFEHADDPALHSFVTDRGQKILKWIINLRSQMAFTEVQQPDPQGNPLHFCIFIDFRRVRQPYWAQVINNERSLDSTIDVRQLIREHYQQVAQTVNAANASKTREATSSVTKLPILSTPSKSAAPPKKQASISDMFAKLKAQPSTKAPVAVAAVMADDPMEVVPSEDARQAAMINFYMTKFRRPEEIETHLRNLYKDYADNHQATDHHPFVTEYLCYLIALVDLFGMPDTKMPTPVREFLYCLMKHVMRSGAKGVQTRNYHEGPEGICTLSNQLLKADKLCVVEMDQLAFPVQTDRMLLINAIIDGFGFVSRYTTAMQHVNEILADNKLSPETKKHTFESAKKDWAQILDITLSTFNRMASKMLL